MAEEPVPAEREPDLLPMDLSTLELTDQVANLPRSRPQRIRRALRSNPTSRLRWWKRRAHLIRPNRRSLRSLRQPVAGLVSVEFQPPTQEPEGIGVELSEDIVLESSGVSEFRVPDASEDFVTVAAG